MLVPEAKTSIAIFVDFHENVTLKIHIILTTLNELGYLLLGVVVADKLVTDGTQQLGDLQ